MVIVVEGLVEGLGVELGTRELLADAGLRPALTKLHAAVAEWIRDDGPGTVTGTLEQLEQLLDLAHTARLPGLVRDAQQSVARPRGGRNMRITRFATASALHALGAELVDVVKDDGRVVYIFAEPAAARALEQLTAAKVALRARAAAVAAAGTVAGGDEDEDPVVGSLEQQVLAGSSNGHGHHPR